MAREAEETLHLASGFPYSIQALRWLTMPVLRGGFLAAAGAGIATWGLLTAMFASPFEGVISEDPGGVVRSVLPGGLAWRDGIRPGQTVLLLEPPETREDWEIVTTDGSVQFRSTARAHLIALRELAPQSALALLLAIVGLAAFARWPRIGGALGLGAATGGLPALSASGDELMTVVGALALPILLGAYLLALGPPERPLRWGVAFAVGAFGVAWLAARNWAPAAFDTVDATGTPLVMALWIAVVATARDWPVVLRLPTLDRATRLDIALLALGAGLLVSLSFLLQPNLLVVILFALVAIVAYGRSRGLLLRALDQLFVASAREQASIAAVEEEKARLARHIHDEPLQTLSGVIRRLEVQPPEQIDIDALRQAAHQLRDVATELNPPVLEDLGLGPALAHLIEQSNARGPVPIDLQFNDWTGLDPGSRLPRDVEVAGYRIVQEALTNAETHSGASAISVTAEISPTAATIEVADDGIGTSDAKIRAAQADGHFGVAHMRRRAEHIGARLAIADNRPRGTRVSISWPRR